MHPHIQLCMPSGALGPIIKPVEWRRWNDSRLFGRDWFEFIRPLKIRRRIIMAYRQAQFERDKNEIRRWWYGLSAREQSYWLGKRADGEFSNIVLAAGFNGPKYQRGNFGMFPAGTTAILGSPTLGLASSNNAAFNIDFSPPGALDAGFGILRNGDHNRINSSGTNQINATTDWVKPDGATIGDSYEVIWNQLTGSAINDESYTEDVWATINVGTGNGRYVGHSTAAAAVSRTFEIDIGDDGASTSDINQDYSVECGELV